MTTPYASASGKVKSIPMELPPPHASSPRKQSPGGIDAVRHVDDAVVAPDVAAQHVGPADSVVSCACGRATGGP